MPDEITFIDLACLLRIGQDTTLEKLGSAINASIFDASNIAGSLKQKGLIDFTAYYPGPNTITITDDGKSLISEAEAKASEPFDGLDDAILSQLSGGKRIPIELQNILNIRPKDLALRLYKLSKQGFIIYELKSGGGDILLTESGFLKSEPASSKPQPAPSPQPQAQPQAQQASAQAPGTQPDPAPQPALQKAPAKSKAMIYAAAVLVVVIVVGVVYYLKKAGIG